jgi:hypothetical protein
MNEEETYKALSKSTPSLQDLTSVKIDGKKYEYVHVPQCRVCSSPEALRKIVDSHLVMMRPYRDILNLVTPLYEKFGVEPKDMISYASLTNHKARHLPTDAIAARSVMERRAAEENKLVIDGVETLLTAKGVYELIASLGVKDIVDGKLEPDIKTTLYAIEKLNDLEKDSTASYRPEYLLGQLSVILDAMREVLPPDMLDLVSKRIEMKQAQFAKKPSVLEMDYIDADLLEEE